MAPICEKMRVIGGWVGQVISIVAKVSSMGIGRMTSAWADDSKVS